MFFNHYVSSEISLANTLPVVEAVKSDFVSVNNLADNNAISIENRICHDIDLCH